MAVPTLAATCLGAALAAALPALAEERSVPAPRHAEGDSWVYDQTLEKGQASFQRTRLVATVDRLDGPTMLIGIKPEGAPTNPVDKLFGQDWSQRRLVDGEQTATTRPFSFPLRIGKSWSVEFDDNTRRGNQLSNHVRRTYTVVDWEDVTVPAGTFHALKVEAKGVDGGMVEIPTTAVGGAAVQSDGGETFTATHRGGQAKLTRVVYAALFYVPAIGTYVKSIDEQYTPDNVRVSRNTLELVSFKPGR